MKNDKKEISYFNLFLIVLGIIFFGELLIQIAFYLGLKIPDQDYYLRLQFVIYTPLGILAYLLTRAKIYKFITALLTIFSLYLINFSSRLVYTIDDPVAYFKENQKEVITAFTNYTLMLLPILIGFVVAEIAKILLPKILKGKDLKAVVSKIKNGAMSKANNLLDNGIKTVMEKRNTAKPKSKTQDTQKKSKGKKSKNAGKKKRGRSKKTK